MATQPETTEISRALGPALTADHEDGVDLGLHAILKIVVRLLIAIDAPERAKALRQPQIEVDAVA